MYTRFDQFLGNFYIRDRFHRAKVRVRVLQRATETDIRKNLLPEGKRGRGGRGNDEENKFRWSGCGVSLRDQKPNRSPQHGLPLDSSVSSIFFILFVRRDEIKD